MGSPFRIHLDPAAEHGWIVPDDRPLDAGGPGDAFPRLPQDFTEEPAFVHLAAQAADRPAGPAIEDGSFRLSYAGLLRAASNLAKGIVATVPPEDCVAILLPNCGLYPVAMFACLAAGRPYVALDARQPPAYNARLIAESGAVAAVIRHDGVGPLPTLPDGVRRINVGLAFAEEGTHPWPDVALPDVDVDAPAVVLFTSGSTGMPKGVANAQRALLQRVRQQVEAGHAGPGDTFMPLAGPNTIAGTREILSALLSGASLRVCDTRAVSLGTVRRQVREGRVTFIYAVPALFRALVAAGDDPRDLAGLKVVRLGGDRVLWSDVDLCRAAAPSALLQVGYSSTETTGSQGFVPHDAARRGATVPIGAMLPGMQYLVLDESGRPAAPGEPGELVVRGRHVALGGWESGRVVPGRIAESWDGTRIVATGDLVAALPDGTFEHVGRKDRQVKVNGLRVEPAELEEALRRHPGVRDAAVIPGREPGNAVLVAFVAAEDPEGGLVEAIRARMRTELPAVLRPARIHLLPALPRLPSHKPDAAALAAIDGAAAPALPPPSIDPPGKASETAVRAAVDRSWRGILGRVDPTTSWDAAGGDSLRFMRLVVELETALGASLPPGSFRLDMIPSEVAAAAAAALGARRRAGGGGRRTVFLCPGSVGDGPALARLREEIGDRVEWVTLRYLDWRETPANSAGVALVAAAVAREVAERQPHGDVLLAGYSFGGPVAAEAATLLEAQGRRVAFLGILDACIVPFAERRAARLIRALSRLGAGLDSPWRILVRRTVRRMILSGRADRVPGLAARLPGGLGFLVELEAADVTRTLAFRDWAALTERPRPGCRVTVFRSQEARPGVPPDLGWSGVATRVAVVEVPGTHLGMIHPPHRSMTAARLGLEILAPAVAGTR